MWLILIALAASVLLVWLLITLRKYEHESASAALYKVTALQEEMEALKKRIEHLEVIAAKDEHTFSKSILEEDDASSEKVGRVPPHRVQE